MKFEPIRFTKFCTDTAVTAFSFTFPNVVLFQNVRSSEFRSYADRNPAKSSSYASVELIGWGGGFFINNITIIIHFLNLIAVCKSLN